MKKLLALVLVVSMSQVAAAQNPYGIKLNPGERLIAIDGKPVGSAAIQPSTISNTTVKSTAKSTAKSPSTATTKSTATKSTAAKTSTVKKSVQPVALSMYSGTDQQRAQAEANYMAQHGIRGHVGGQIGNFEGCGWSTGGTPPTCTPGRAMTLTADATAYGPGGVYRVRAWR